MMKFSYIILFVIIPIIFLINACQQVHPKIQETSDCKDLYYRELVKDISNNDYNVAVNAEYGGEKFSILLNRSQLLSLLDSSKSLNDSVNTKMIVTRQKALSLNDQEVNSFIIIKPWKSIDTIANKGKEETLNYYFKNRRMQSRYVSSPERDYLISLLNKWCILTYVDDETGYIKIKEVKQE